MLASLWWLVFLVPTLLRTGHALPQSQLVFNQPNAIAELGVGHFSEWSAQTKAQFLADVRAGKASNWTLVMGNEGGDLDSMAAAFTWAYHLGHVDPSRPAIGLLQTAADALDLRPENKLALDNVKMSPGHQDLLTIDELPIPAEELSGLLRGIVLVDHPEPVPDWKNATVLSIFDHHVDHGAAPGASPRIFLPTASCSTIVGRQMLDEIETLPEGEYHLPHELLELLLSAIAIDSKGLQSRIATPTDKFVASRLFRRSNWRNENLYDKMDELSDALKKVKKDLDHLNVRDLLRRDWKGGLIRTPASHPDVHIGYASIPYSLTRQIELTPRQSLSSWFAIERNWTAEIHADASIALLSYKRVVDQHGTIREEQWLPDEEDGDDDDDDGDLDSQLKKHKIKERQIVLVVRTDPLFDENEANALFETISDAIASNEVLLAKPWSRSHELGKRQMVWTHHVAVNGGRKLIRPIVDGAVRQWT